MMVPELRARHDSTAEAYEVLRARKRFISYRLRGDFEKPWLKDPKFKKTKVNNWIIYGFVLLGTALAGLVAWLQIKGSLPTDVSCLISLVAP